MKPKDTTLVMAGAREAHALVTALMARGRRVIASLPEPERMFDALPVPTRLGGFASAPDLTCWLAAQQVGTVIDASHAFDDGIGAMIRDVCISGGVRYLRVLRPPWYRTLRDHWIQVETIREAMHTLPACARVFSNTGWPTIPDYADFSGHRLYMRQTHVAVEPAPFAFLEFIEGTPPFTQFQEQALFSNLRITHLVCRNVGGAASMSKVLAAREMGLPVYMVARPPMPADVPVVETVAEALSWLDA